MDAEFPLVAQCQISKRQHVPQAVHAMAPVFGECGSNRLVVMLQLIQFSISGGVGEVGVLCRSPICRGSAPTKLFDHQAGGNVSLCQEGEEVEDDVGGFLGDAFIAGC